MTVIYGAPSCPTCGWGIEACLCRRGNGKAEALVEIGSELHLARQPGGEVDRYEPVEPLSLRCLLATPGS